MRVLQQQVGTLQRQLEEAVAARSAVEAQLLSVRKQASVKQHRQHQGAAAVQRVQAEAEAARREADEMRRVGGGAGLGLLRPRLWAAVLQGVAAGHPARHIKSECIFAPGRASSTPDACRVSGCLMALGTAQRCFPMPPPELLCRPCLRFRRSWRRSAPPAPTARRSWWLCSTSSSGCTCVWSLLGASDSTGC